MTFDVFLRSAVLAAACFTTSCITLPREDGPPPAPEYAKIEGFSEQVRTVGVDTQMSVITEETLGKLKLASDGSVDFLALSGGGAGGSFGAGVLIGMTESGNRPQFEVVTGVSTGALIAPFAFLGPDWDDELAEAFASDSSAEILENRGFGILFSTSFFKGEPLEALVDTYVTDELISAIADEAETGRSLVVATTNLDRQLATYWDLGRIASLRNSRARELFRDVLIASASVPGVFPPVMFDVYADGETYQEMHVDGGASVPFFLGPELLAIWNDPLKNFANSNLYVIVNGQLQAPVSETPVNTVQIIAKSFDTMMIFGARSALATYANLAADNGMNFNVAFIPPDLAFGGSLNFKTEERSRVFGYAKTCASQELIWFSQGNLIEGLQNADVSVEDLKVGQGIPAHCPTQFERALQNRENARLEAEQARLLEEKIKSKED